MKTFETVDRILQKSQLPGELYAKWQDLYTEVASYQSVLVAFSGGVDSSFLAFVCACLLGERMLAVTIDSSLEPPGQIEQAVQFAREQAFKHIIIPFDAFQNQNIITNSSDRCYHCKKAILGILSNYARQNGYQVVLEGQNKDDEGDYRPGRKAVLESGTRSPLAYNQLTKAEIRGLMQVLNLSIWDMPSSPCLATRLPYGTRITGEKLIQIATAELYLSGKGFKSVRVRHHGDLARIEIDPQQIPALISMRGEIVAEMKKMGFLYITLDLQGYRSGSFNEGVQK